jgi:Kef-type K+ transport system membrane component KefB
VISDLLLSLLAIFAAAKLFGELAERIGQPGVLGEMIGGIIIGVSGFHLIDAHNPVLHVLAEWGGILLLFLIGLETFVSVGAAVELEAVSPFDAETRQFFVTGILLTIVAIVGKLLAAKISPTSPRCARCLRNRSARTRRTTVNLMDSLPVWLPS